MPSYVVKLVGISRATAEMRIEAKTRKEAERKAVRAGRKKTNWKYDGQITGVGVHPEQPKK